MPESPTASAQADNAIRQSLGLMAGRPAAAQAAPPQAQPAAQPAQPQNQEGELAELRAQNELMRSQMVQMSQNVEALMGELQTRKQTVEDVKLPTDEELDALPRTEAIKKVAEVKAIEVINQRLMPGLRRMAGDMLEVKAFADEETIRKVYPNLQLEKYRPALNERRASSPGLSALDAIRLVADPKDLTVAAPAARPQEAVHMEARGRASAAPTPQQRQDGPSEAELRQGFLDARKAGNRLLADRYLTRIMQLRPDVPATRRM